MAHGDNSSEKKCGISSQLEFLTGALETAAKRELYSALQDDGAISVRLGITPDEAIRALWPHPFELILEITVGRSLLLTFPSKKALSTDPEISSL